MVVNHYHYDNSSSGSSGGFMSSFLGSVAGNVIGHELTTDHHDQTGVVNQPTQSQGQGQLLDQQNNDLGHPWIVFLIIAASLIGFGFVLWRIAR